MCRFLKNNGVPALTQRTPSCSGIHDFEGWQEPRMSQWRATDISDNRVHSRMKR
jgi:hypothetical protein